MILFVETFCGHFLWTLFVDTFCGNFLWALFVETFCGHFLWTHFVDTFCGRFLWTLFVDTFCGHFLWTLFVDTLCGHFLWTLFVDTFFFVPNPPPLKKKLAFLFTSVCSGIGATIRIGRKIQCLPYAGFSNPFLPNPALYGSSLESKNFYIIVYTIYLF